MNRRDFLIRLGWAIPAVKTVVSFGTGLWTPSTPGFGMPDQWTRVFLELIDTVDIYETPYNHEALIDHLYTTMLAPKKTIFLAQLEEKVKAGIYSRMP